MLLFFPRDVLDEIWDLIESVFKRFPTYFSRYGAQIEIFDGCKSGRLDIIFKQKLQRA